MAPQNNQRAARPLQQRNHARAPRVAAAAKHKRTRYSQGGVHANVQVAVHLALHIALQRSIKNNGMLQTTARA